MTTALSGLQQKKPSGRSSNNIRVKDTVLFSKDSLYTSFAILKLDNCIISHSARKPAAACASLF